LRREILSALQRNPIPGVLYRRCIEATSVGDLAIGKGEYVLLRQSSAAGAADGRSWGLLFGHGVHQCPGATAGLAMIAGIVSVLFRLPNARPAPGRLAIAFDA
jgi:cytochrome P450